MQIVVLLVAVDSMDSLAVRTYFGISCRCVSHWLSPPRERRGGTRPLELSRGLFFLDISCTRGPWTVDFESGLISEFSRRSLQYLEFFPR